MALPDNHANEQASASALIPSSPTSAPKGAPTTPPTAARAQFEAERMSRRAALRKFGFGAGMAALLALSSDDLARMAAAKLKQHAGDNKVANQVADEFRNAGIAFANPSSGHPPGDTSVPKSCDGADVGAFCAADGTRKACNQCCTGTYDNYCKKQGGAFGLFTCEAYCNRYVSP